MPRVSLRCPNGHDFTANIAKIGGTTQCPACWQNERRRVAVRAGKQAFAAAGLGTGGRGAASLGELEAEAARLAELWAAEAPAASALADLESDAGQPCRKCGGPRYWAGAHTVLVCLACRIKDTSPGAWQREKAHAEGKARARQRQGGELAVPDRAAERAARIQLHARREHAHALAAELEAIGDPRAYDHRHDQEQARAVGAAARAYHPEIDRADDAEVTEIEGELRQARISPLVRGLELEAERVRQRHQAAELAERDAREIARRRELAERQQAGQRRAELAGRQARALPSGRQAGTAARTQAIEATMRTLLEAQARLQRNGACDFHRWAKVPATRLYRPAVNGYAYGAAPRTPERRACARHYQRAEAALGELGHAQVVYWELT